MRLGSTRSIAVDVRLVCATNRNLPAIAESGEYRKDFFERIQGIPITLPPLRERREEIAPLARHFCERAQLGVVFDDDAVAVLEAQPWTGNVRQLENFVRRLVVLSDHDRISAADVEDELAHSAIVAAPVAGPSASGPMALRSLSPEEEKARIVAVLERTRGNITRAAEALEIGRRTLHKKLDAYRLR
jgi:two-component system response regulator AtoC